MANRLRENWDSETIQEDGVDKVVRSCPLPVIIFDRDELTILEANDSALSLYEYSRAELVGETIEKLRYQGSDIAAVNRIIERLFTEEGTKVWAHQNSSGEILFVKLTGVSTGDVTSGSYVVFIESRKPTFLRESDALSELKRGNNNGDWLAKEYSALKNSVEFYADQVQVVKNIIHETQGEPDLDREARRSSIEALLKRVFRKVDVKFLRCEGENAEYFGLDKNSSTDSAEHEVERVRTQDSVQSLWQRFLLDYSKSAWVDVLDDNKCMFGVVHFRRPVGWIAVLKNQTESAFSKFDIAAFEVICLILYLNAKLASAEQQIMQLNRFETMGEIIGTIAHDFNNLLQIIAGNADVFERALRKNEKLGPLSVTNSRAVRSASELAGKLLSFSSLRHRNLERISVVRMLSDLDHLLCRSIPENISIVYEVGNADWEFLADAVQFENAILNLCLNAREAMPHGGSIRICVDQITSTKELALVNNLILPRGDYLKLSVEDCGVGIDASDFENVFKPFFSKSEIKIGRGLGLSSVQRFVEDLGGGITLESRKGEGTIVSLYFRRILEKQSGEGENCSLMDHKASSERNRILYVEDDNLVRGHVITQLANENVNVLEAQSGADALRIIQSIEKLDVLITDVIMPGFNGDKLALLAIKKFPDLKIVFTSGYGSDKFTDRDSLDSIGTFLRKPFRVSDLISVIRTMKKK